MIRLGEACDELVIRDCAELSYGRYMPMIRLKPAQFIADYATQSVAGVVYVAQDD